MYYMGGGVVAVLALFTNLFFIFGSLASLGTVLTLPGIAGIVLTMGMAVDSNVIIFERIREELRAGKTMLSAIADGFKHSYSAIIDANVTTILVAAVLAYFGIGPIKGIYVCTGRSPYPRLVDAPWRQNLLLERHDGQYADQHQH
jgi:SecD/SecF fusion protein